MVGRTIESKIEPMRHKGKKSWLTEVWALIAVAVIAFVGGLLVGDLGASPTTKTVHVSASVNEGEEAATSEPSSEAEEEAGGGSSGAQVFASAGCGSCHTMTAAGSTGTTGPNLDESLAPDDNTAGIEEMILHPNEEVIEGYPPNVMPQTYGETLSTAETHELAEYLVESTPAKP
jgi:mono/diheme cytochrome c family protein